MLDDIVLQLSFGSIMNIVFVPVIADFAILTGLNQTDILDTLPYCNYKLDGVFLIQTECLKERILVEAS